MKLADELEAEGWVEVNSKGLPCNPFTKIEALMFADGDVIRGIGKTAGSITWENWPDFPDSNIIAYLPVLHAAEPVDDEVSQIITWIERDVLPAAREHGVTQGLWLFAHQWETVLSGLRALASKKGGE